MSSIKNLQRAILAVCQPLSGTRASGTVTVTAVGADVTLPRNTYAVPIIRGKHRSDLVFKTATGPNDDKSWTVTSAGTDVDFISNIGGDIYNISDGTRMEFDPPIWNGQIASSVVNGDFTGGVSRSDFLAINDMVIIEHITGPNRQLDLRRSESKGIPPWLVIGWSNSEPADGSTVTHNVRGTRVDNTNILYREIFQLFLIVSRAESLHIRSEQAMYILDALTALLTDNHMVDGISISNPSGLQIISRSREQMPQAVYQRYEAFRIDISAMGPYCRQDDREYNDWLLTNIDVEKPQDPPLPNQGDLTMVDDMIVDMRP